MGATSRLEVDVFRRGGVKTGFSARATTFGAGLGFAGFGVGEDGAREKTSCEGVCVERGEERGEEKEETCVCPAWECVVVSSTVSSANSSNSSNPFTSSLFVSTIRERVSE